MESSNKSVLARELGVSRGSLYYKTLQPNKDWQLKCLIEETLRNHPSYGSRRISLHLKMNRKPVQRVMNIFGIKAYRRRGRKWKKTRSIKVIYPNLLLTEYPKYENHIWVSDFTRIPFQGKIVYVATVEDLFTRKVVGVLKRVGVLISRSSPSCPWENGYQESFYDKFKIDLGDPSRFKTLGKLVSAIYEQIHYYNQNRIHSALKMSPVQFAEIQKSITIQHIE